VRSAASRTYVLRPLAGAQAPAAVAGLSKSHNRPFGSITFLRGAGFAKVVTPSESRERPSGATAKRAEVSCFSDRSRQRLRIKIASVCRSEPPLFCTLTYPAEWTWDAKLWKRHLKIFSQRFLRRWPSAGFIWKLEFQKRGAPHFHPFVWGIADDQLRDFRHWISDVWNEIAGDGDPNHLLAGTSVEQMRNPGAAIRYVSGYASKTDQTRPGEKVGRYWGVVGRNKIPWGKVETVNLDQEQSKIVVRTMRRYIQAVNRQSRVRRVAKLVALKPEELIGWGGWFDRRRIHYGKHLRAAGKKMPPKIHLRNLRSLNVFLDADFWATKLPTLIVRKEHCRLT
jgi:hypothetical protein